MDYLERDNQGFSELAMKRKSTFKTIEFIREKTTAVGTVPPISVYKPGDKAQIVDWLAEKWIAQGYAKEASRGVVVP